MFLRPMVLSQGLRDVMQCSYLLLSKVLSTARLPLNRLYARFAIRHAMSTRLEFKERPNVRATLRSWPHIPRHSGLGEALQPAEHLPRLCRPPRRLQLPSYQ